VLLARHERALDVLEPATGVVRRATTLPEESLGLEGGLCVAGDTIVISGARERIGLDRETLAVRWLERGFTGYANLGTADAFVSVRVLERRDAEIWSFDPTTGKELDHAVLAGSPEWPKLALVAGRLVAVPSPERPGLRVLGAT
jgi:hypothetical protein